MPALTAHEGAGLAGTVWDARAEVDFGLFIRRYIGENPPPEDSLFIGDFETWAARLIRHGEARLSTTGARRLRPAAGGDL